MQLLPKWTLTDRFPAFYDTESGSTIEQTARVYGAMQTLIQEYNTFVEEINSRITGFEGETKEEVEQFKTCITELVHNFIHCIESKIDKQDVVIGDAVAYMKTNLVKTTNEAVAKLAEDGDIVCTDEVAREWIANQPNYVTPQMFGAVGDGVTDDTAAFIAADQSERDVYVPIGKYVVNNFTFDSAKEWLFERSKTDQWFDGGKTGETHADRDYDDCAVILSSTGLTIDKGAKISNMVLRYNGSEEPANRPVGLQMKCSYCELHSLHVSKFYIGLNFGEGSGGHSSYVRVTDLYAWYNYFCGVRLAGTNTEQVNFISFYDCNAGSNGVSVHDKTVAPDTSRGYGFYIGTANSVLISNADVSSNETCGVYLNSSDANNTPRGIVVDTIYAEHNKHSNIYFNNGLDSDTCRCRFVDISNAFFINDETDEFFTQNVYMANVFIPPTVSLLEVRGDTSLYDGYSPSINMARAGINPQGFYSFYGMGGNTYKITLDVMPLGTGNITFQNILCKYDYKTAGGSYYELRARDAENNLLSSFGSFTVPVTEGERKKFVYYASLPDSYDGRTFVCKSMNTGVSYTLLDGCIENVTTLKSTETVYGNVPAGVLRMNGTTHQVYDGSAWKDTCASNYTDVGNTDASTTFPSTLENYKVVMIEGILCGVEKDDVNPGSGYVDRLRITGTGMRRPTGTGHSTGAAEIVTFAYTLLKGTNNRYSFQSNGSYLMTCTREATPTITYSAYTTVNKIYAVY